MLSPVGNTFGHSTAKSLCKRSLTLLQDNDRESGKETTKEQLGCSLVFLPEHSERTKKIPGGDCILFYRQWDFFQKVLNAHGWRVARQGAVQHKAS